MCDIMEKVGRLRLLEILIVFNPLYHILAVRFLINYLMVCSLVSLFVVKKGQGYMGNIIFVGLAWD